MINKSKKIFEEVRVLFILILIAFTVKSTLLEIYVVPTGSMENTILTGDMLVGNKFIYGMRTPTWIGIPWTRLGFDIPWVRLPSFKKVENGDITIFEFPRDPFQKYVKRCVGLPGDSVYVESGRTYVNSIEMEFPSEGKYVKGHIYKPGKIESSLYPYFSGNRDNIEAFIVPHKGMKINFKNVVDWETIITLLVQDGNEVKIYDKTFIMTDPVEVARTHSFIANKIYRLFSNAKFVVSPTGSSLTNVVFCSPGTKVVEIKPKYNFEYENNFKTRYSYLCDQLDLNYFSVEADPIDLDKLRGKSKELIQSNIVNESNYYKNLLLKLDKVSQIIAH